MTRTSAAALRPGDRVQPPKNQVTFEVAAIEFQQGRVQVTDTTGEVHTYHRSDPIELARR